METSEFGIECNREEPELPAKGVVGCSLHRASVFPNDSSCLGANER